MQVKTIGVLTLYKHSPPRFKACKNDPKYLRIKEKTIMDSIFEAISTGKAILVSEEELPKILAQRGKYIKTFMVLPDDYALVIFMNEGGNENED